MTLSDLERRNSHNFAFFSPNSIASDTVREPKKLELIEKSDPPYPRFYGNPNLMP